jgi:hypothetical protein
MNFIKEATVPFRTTKTRHRNVQSHYVNTDKNRSIIQVDKKGEP